MGATVIPFGSIPSMLRQSVGLFAATMQRKTILNRLCGAMPSQKDAENKLRLQSSTDYPILRCMDLTKFAGDRITFDLVNQVGGLPIMGDAYAQGMGDAITFGQDGLRINVTRKPVSAGSMMSQQRTLHELKALSVALAYGYMSRLEDQRTLVHLAGARGFHNNGEWAVPLAAHAEFASIMINPVRAPSNNRHFVVQGASFSKASTVYGAGNIATTDTMSLDTLDALRTWIDGAPFAPGAVKFDGDELAEDSPLRVLLVSSEQYTAFLKSSSGSFRTLQAQSTARAAAAKNNPIMLGDAALWNGILLVKMPKPIRFYTADPILYCAVATTQTESSYAVPGGFGTGFAVDRALLLGSQALGQALGKAKLMNKSGEESVDGVPMFYSEEIMDHGARPEILVGMVNGMSKIQFLMDMGTQSEYTDFGVVAIDTAVVLAGN